MLDWSMNAAARYIYITTFVLHLDEHEGRRSLPTKIYEF